MLCKLLNVIVLTLIKTLWHAILEVDSLKSLSLKELYMNIWKSACFLFVV